MKQLDCMGACVRVCLLCAYITCVYFKRDVCGFTAKNHESSLDSVSQRVHGNYQTTLKGSMGERINKALAKVEEKKRKRALRRSEVRDQGKVREKATDVDGTDEGRNKEERR